MAESGVALAKLPKTTPTPVLRLDAAQISRALERFRLALPTVTPFYAVKCNPALGVLGVLAAAGCEFEVASVSEVELLQRLGVDPASLLFSNPVRGLQATGAAYRSGVRRFSFDSVGELQRLAVAAPGSEVYVRLATPTVGSVVQSEGKFGVPIDTAAALLLAARSMSLVPYGVSFHVGSQMLQPVAWRKPLQDCASLMRELLLSGVHLTMVDVGGGFPASYGDPVPSIATFGEEIAHGLAELPYPVAVVAEPGRCLVAEAGTLEATILGVAERPSGTWLHTDLGVFNGMMEVLETGGQLHYPLSDSRCSPAKRLYNLTGPTCDSQDTIAMGVPLSADLCDGDRVYVGSSGAYTTAYATDFNGFPRPEVTIT